MNRLVRRTVAGRTDAFETVTVGSYTDAFPMYSSVGMVIPAQVDTFAYDVMGRLVKADNDVARISRSYLPGGLLSTDTLRVTNLAGDSFSHVYE